MSTTTTETTSRVGGLPSAGLTGRAHGSGSRVLWQDGLTVLRQTALLMQWQARRSVLLLPIYVVVQVMLALATVLGYDMLVGDPDPVSATYLATGAPTLLLIMLGLVVAPQWVSQSRTEGSLDWMRTLPVRRMAFLVADLTVWTLVALPGVVVGAVVGAWRFDVDLSPTWWLAPGVLLVALTAACVGYAMANLLPPALAQLMTQVLVFVTLLFSPISFPVERLPEWGQEVHRWLPLEPMAQLVRSGLVPESFTMPARSWVVLGAWCVVAVVSTLWALGSRPPEAPHG